MSSKVILLIPLTCKFFIFGISPKTKLDRIIILCAASKLLKIGGRLVYATCSLLQEENEQQVEWFLANFSNFSALAMDDIWRETIGGKPPSVGAGLRLSPASTGTDGFFCAVLERQN